MSDTPPTRAYHYVLTLLDGGRNVTASDTVSVEPGQTRQDVFRKVFNEQARSLGMHRPTVLCWSLEPNHL